MWKVRTTKTGSGNTAVQVVERSHQKTLIIKHIGTGHTREEIAQLQEKAYAFIRQKINTPPLFPDLFGQQGVFTLPEIKQAVQQLRIIQTTHTFAYECLSSFYDSMGFSKVQDDLLRDLSLIRLVTPCSKIQSLKLLAQYFDISYGQTKLYTKLQTFPVKKDLIENLALSYAKEQLLFDFSIVFYDVTTLYYESFTQDTDTVDMNGTIVEKGLRKNGFGKEKKVGQPIVMIGLIVTKEGFPIAYEVFEGDTFEGRTFIPIILKFKNKYAIENLTIVADAAMISFDNVEKLKANRLSYIVGGRMANLKQSEIQEISSALISAAQTDEELAKKDKGTYRIKTERGLLLCEFSFKRYLKDKWEMEKQIAGAEKLVNKNTEGKRAKFLKLKKTEQKKKQKNEKFYEVNTPLIEQTKLLLGIKGYYTNLFEKVSENNYLLANQGIITQYHNLWHVEKAFRIAKSDLQARPIFHHKRKAIEAHILIVFVSLCLAKRLELLTKKSIKKIIDTLWEIEDVTFEDRITKARFTQRMERATNDIMQFFNNLKNVDNLKKEKQNM